MSNEQGFYFFKFSQEGVYKKLMDAGPWHFGSTLLVLKDWSPQMSLVKEKFARVPIWAQFYQDPLELWNEAGLSYVASAVGVPLHADSLTENCDCLSYARICVEVEVGSELPDTVDVEYKVKAVTIAVKYPWRPVKCLECHLFGHSAEQCAAKVHGTKHQRSEWVVKPVVAPGGERGMTATVHDMGSIGLGVDEPVSTVVGLATSSDPVSHSGNGVTHEVPLSGICDKDGLLLVEEMRHIKVTPCASPSVLHGARGVQLSGVRNNNTFSALAVFDEVEVGPSDPLLLESDSLPLLVDPEEAPVVAAPSVRGRGKNKGGTLAAKGGGGISKR